MSISKIMAISTASLVFAAPAAAKMTTCRLTYEISGWSFLYKEFRGGGKVTCENGQNARVRIVSREGGFSFGKSKIKGSGSFSQVSHIDEIFGTYITATGHAGVTTSVEARVMTQGTWLALRGKGRGFDLGFAFGGFTISRK